MNDTYVLDLDGAQQNKFARYLYPNGNYSFGYFLSNNFEGSEGKFVAKDNVDNDDYIPIMYRIEFKSEEDMVRFCMVCL